MKSLIQAATIHNYSYHRSCRDASIVSYDKWKRRITEPREKDSSTEWMNVPRDEEMHARTL